ncbi:nicotinamide riboside transporter PnuC [Agaribacter flavus]|uniref:Nicotinamide riboside transporter PnuC n=1 Tax=Agaribacter flavus TaxID=1902781 RepID=A0ABV7FPF5_9ALTE
MDEVWQALLSQWQSQSGLELFAVALAIAYVWLATEESIWCWPAALISTSLYTFIYWDVSLLFQVLLNAYYAVMAVVGWLSWRQKPSSAVLLVSIMSTQQHLLFIASAGTCTALIYFFAAHWLSYEQLLLDASITVFSLFTTFLTVRKKRASWLYWIIINAATVYLVVKAGLIFTALLMLIYIVIAIKGYWQWTQSMQAPRSVADSAV